METKTLTKMCLLTTLLEEPLFLGPVILIALAKLAHMSTEQIFLSETVCMLIILLLDAPSGILADMIGRKKCVILGKVIFLIAIFFIAFMTTPLHGFIANVLWSISVVLCSGAESALIYDEFIKRNANEEYKIVIKKSNSYKFFLLSFTAFASGFLAEIDLRLPLILSIPLVVISTILIFFFPKEISIKKEHSYLLYKQHIIEAFGEIYKKKKLRELILWLAILGVMSHLYFFTYNPYLILVTVPYRDVGIIFAVINIFAFLVARYAFVLQEKMKKVGFGFTFLFSGIIMIIQANFLHYLSGWLIALQGFQRGYFTTITEPLLNKEIESEKRATVLSCSSSFGSLLASFCFLITSSMSNNIPLLLMILGITSILFAFLSRKI